ncbi:MULTISPECIES: hypothetical protein [Bacillus subtilis group]|uniref:hypothetical protein n=1 Tax=Bacillus subtilis group TaxID=653685 RepID=UPI000FFE1A55|nr:MULTISPECIES: hypothetical protein [Bacillus subtilis group]MEC1053542.1 hypothetical protein [Bacillus paralicheniformis]MEC1088550.1 hypothetical protein [Bacillus paralicheniformis]MEC1104900.1 hypothetical protein [Bacillus paralicheniformis]MEC1112149.1 hypothetical protein [Bacillus paralicheniformis]MEC1141155.1 hypothetical protein [Bacillus paralicheniformis]
MMFDEMVEEVVSYHRSIIEKNFPSANPDKIQEALSELRWRLRSEEEQCSDAGGFPDRVATMAEAEYLMDDILSTGILE